MIPVSRTDGLFLLADELLAAAEHEQQRAEEDVVPSFICWNSRQAVSNYLAGFLLQKNIPIEHPVSIESLHKQCLTIDARFEKLDLTPLNCRMDTNDRAYCLEHDKVDLCLRIAFQLKAEVMS